MPTFEVVCAKCRQKKWPDLPARPDRYVCALCLMLTPEQRAKRLATGAKASQSRKTRLQASEDVP